MNDTMIPLIKGDRLLDISPLGDLPDDAWWRLTLCRYFAAAFTIRWAPCGPLFTTRKPTHDHIQ